MSGPVRIGWIGFGAMAERGHLPRVRALADLLTPVAVVDPTAARRDLAQSLGMRPFKTVREYLDSGIAEATIIATPPKLHCEQALECIAAGHAVLVEKPIGLTLAETDLVVRAAKEAGRVLSVVHNRRYDADFLTVQKALRGGTLGTVHAIESRLHTWGSAVGFGVKEFKQAWRHEAAWGGGALYEWGVHLLDQLGQLVAETPERVFAHTRPGRWAKDTDDFLRVMVGFNGDGPSALVEVNYMARCPGPRWLVTGTQGTLSTDPLVRERIKFFHADRDVEEVLPKRAGDATVIFSSFAQAVRGKGKPAVSPESVRRAMRLVDAALVSAREGIAVEIK